LVLRQPEVYRSHRDDGFVKEEEVAEGGKALTGRYFAEMEEAARHIG